MIGKRIYSLSSFTIVEVAVVLLLSAIIVSMAYGVYLNFMSDVIVFGKKNDKFQDIVFFEKKFTQDFKQSDYIYAINESDLVLKFESNEVYYHINKENVLRRVSLTDTFKVKCVLTNLEFLKHYNANSKPLLSSIQIMILGSDTFSINLKKQYTIAKLLLLESAYDSL
jgi:hypothetical protein